MNWYRNGVRIRPSRRIVPTLDDDGFVELVISNATLDDAGNYRCVATNAVGKAESTCSVIIENCDSNGMKIIPSICEPNMPYSKEPLFVTKPRSIEAFEGDTVFIEITVVGDPKPEIIWLRDFLNVSNAQKKLFKKNFLSNLDLNDTYRRKKDEVKWCGCVCVCLIQIEPIDQGSFFSVV